LGQEARRSAESGGKGRGHPIGIPSEKKPRKYGQIAKEVAIAQSMVQRSKKGAGLGGERPLLEIEG